MSEAYDVAIIGGGPGGYVAAIRAAQLGLKTVCVEKRKTLGGTCLNVGCIPSKALLDSSHHYAFCRDSAENHGIKLKQVSLDFPTLMKRKDEVVKGLTEGVAHLLKKHKVEWCLGEAQLVSPHKIAVDGQELEAKQIVIATGSEPIALPFLPFDEKRVLSSTGALALEKIPQKLLVIGAGVIGVELASVYQRLKSEVTVLEMLDVICPAMDPAISKALLQSLQKQGIAFHLGVKVTSAKVTPKQVTLTFEREGKTEEQSADAVLVAVGRRPYTQGLGLKEIGIQVDKRGFIEVDASFRTAIPSIYAIGDVIEGAMLAHRASEEGVAVAELLAGQQPRVNYMAIPNVIYTHPEAAAVGLTEPEAREAGLDVHCGIFPMRANARARTAGESEGFVKVIGERANGRLLGLHILSPHASEMIGEGAVALENKMSVEQLAKISHAHPTLSESIKEACLHWLGHSLHI